jgi:hypothetical protein
MHGTRLRQRQTGVEAKPLRRRVDRRQQVEIAALAVDDKGSRSPRTALSLPLPASGERESSGAFGITPLMPDAVGREAR